MLKPKLVSKCKESELCINDLADVIESMCPIQIIIDNKSVWDDNTDVTGFSEEKIRKVMEEESENFYFILSSKLPVYSINFQIVDYHHSIVWIRTKK